MTEVYSGSGGQSQIYPAFTLPVDANYSWINQGTGTRTVNANGGITITAPKSASASAVIRQLSLAGASSWTLTTCVIPACIGNAQISGILARESSSGKLATWGLASQSAAPNANLQIYHWASATSRPAATVTVVFAPSNIIWFRLKNDGTNMIYSFSSDGYNFVQVLSEAQTTPFTTAPDNVGFFADDETNTYTSNTTLLSWNLTTP